MPLPRFEELTGDRDGANVDFVAPTSYIAGTLTLWIRGLPRPLANEDGGTETDPALGLVELKEAPLADDVVAAFYLEPTAGDAAECEELFGTIEGDSVAGEFADVLEVVAAIEGDEIAGTIVDVTEFEGTIEGDEIVGEITIC
jgi:hypothetical protein